MVCHNRVLLSERFELKFGFKVRRSLNQGKAKRQVIACPTRIARFAARLYRELQRSRAELSLQREIKKR
ncbi:hypothetical protein EZV77_16815 [Burkholderia thailandensis]|nr:hypothetical protein A8H32_27370 [Burkholderia thailandensis]MDD1479518.1 hypothetical protein [Burkholderia thailandensis]MDD1485183.1 hypothetical protein [Burkholderia thailandensis]MDD1491892.1 hypothetical protein [Burkholderia thailandensis]PJO71297.1 hypothetical protein CWD92_16655 [Burkholderia thailandensis]